MNPGSFEALAEATLMGLLADDVLLALASLGGNKSAAIEDERRKEAIRRAKRFLEEALDSESRERLSKEIDRKAILSAQAYLQAVDAIRACEVEGAPGEPDSEQEMRAADDFLREVHRALSAMASGEDTPPESQNRVRGFFQALSRMMRAKRALLNERPPLAWTPSVGG